jgi:heme/copper-type cytochrome/quinol oxidase subunit 4
MIHKRDVAPEPNAPKDRTQIDDQPLAVALSTILGLIPTGVYYATFSDFGTTMLPWKICATITGLVPIFVLLHFAVNRRRRRMWWSGCATLIGGIPIWLLLGSWWVFYFACAPMPNWVRAVALTLCGGGTVYWIRLIWQDYARMTSNLHLEQRLFEHESSRIIFSIASANQVLPFLAQRNPFTKMHRWAATTLAPIFVGILLTSSQVFGSFKGPHALFLVESFFAFPMSQYVLAYFGVRTAFFDLYLPLKLERETGKKVILSP